VTRAGAVVAGRLEGLVQEGPVAVVDGGERATEDGDSVVSHVS
jgi:hypothetical protein